MGIPHPWMVKGSVPQNFAHRVWHRISPRVLEFLLQLYKLPYSRSRATALGAASDQLMALIYPTQRILLMMGHASVILLIVQANWLTGLMNRFRAVGQMAFTNYIIHS